MTDIQPDVGDMTPEIRAYQRQARLVMHSLQIFLHLQEMNFNDPRVVHDGLFALIEHTVRCLLLGPGRLFLTFIQTALCGFEGYNPAAHPLYSEVFKEIGNYFQAHPAALVPRNWPKLLQTSDELLKDVVFPVSLFFAISNGTIINSLILA